MKRSEGFFQIVTILKFLAVVAGLAAVGYAGHLVMEHFREQGRREVRLECAAASAKFTKKLEDDRKSLQAQVLTLSRQYHAERTVREDMQRQLDREREDAIRNSGVAASVCFDERMRDNWNRDSGHAGPPTSREAGRGVAPAVRKDAVAP